MVLGLPLCISRFVPFSQTHRRIETVYIERIPDPDGNWPPVNDRDLIHVIIRNIGTDFVQSYAIWVAQTMAATATSMSKQKTDTATKVLVVHEADGKIISGGIPFDETDGPIRLIPEEGQYVSEVAMPHLPELSGLETSPQLDFNILKNFKLEFGDTGARLIRKQ